MTEYVWMTLFISVCCMPSLTANIRYEALKKRHFLRCLDTHLCLVLLQYNTSRKLRFWHLGKSTYNFLKTKIVHYYCVTLPFTVKYST